MFATTELVKITYNVARQFVVNVGASYTHIVEKRTKGKLFFKQMVHQYIFLTKIQTDCNKWG